ncbi:MAG TPA: outer membrane beta-barrel protein [Gammaproteobacteria bacterium]|nr:outer membrane beta-barrel protein [Gammaproteobacteria bacterium]
MKTRLWIVATTLAASLYSAAASAEMVIGVKGGAVDYDADWIGSTEPGLNGSLQLAFDIFDLGFADIAVEGEYSTTLTEAEIDLVNSIIPTLDASLDTTALYLSLRTAGPVYVIARVGYAKSDLKLENDFGSISDDDTAASTGIGVGFSMGVRMEIEYTQYKPEFDTFGDTDIKYLTLGFGF